MKEYEKTLNYLIKEIDIALEDENSMKAQNLLNASCVLMDYMESNKNLDKDSTGKKFKKEFQNITNPLLKLKQFCFYLQREAYKEKNIEAGMEASLIAGNILEAEERILSFIEDHPNIDLGEYK